MTAKEEARLQSDAAFAQGVFAQAVWTCFGMHTMQREGCFGCGDPKTMKRVNHVPLCLHCYNDVYFERMIRFGPDAYSDIFKAVAKGINRREERGIEKIGNRSKTQSA